MLPAGIDADYDLAYEHFDVMHFLLQARQLLSSEASTRSALPRQRREGQGQPGDQLQHAVLPRAIPGEGRRTRAQPLRRVAQAGQGGRRDRRPRPGLEKMAPVLGMSPRTGTGWPRPVRPPAAAADRHARGDVRPRCEVEPLIGEVWGETARPTIPPLRPSTPSSRSPRCRPASGRRLRPGTPGPGGLRPAMGRRSKVRGPHRTRTDRPPRPARHRRHLHRQGGTAPPGRFPVGVREIDLARAGDGWIGRPRTACSSS